MVTDRHRLEYEQRVNRVLDYIREHRAEDLTLETLAQVAAFSPFHFHRLFKSIVGENVKEFIQRTRLESAASQLVFRRDTDILEIAIDNGFSSASAFARAFKERFGVTATEWRAQSSQAACNLGETDRNLCQADSNAGKADDVDRVHAGAWPSNHGGHHQEDIMNVTIKALPTYHVAYMRYVGPYGTGEGIPQLWQKLARWASARDLWTDGRICLGIALDDPMVTEPAKCRYDAAIVVPADFKPDSAVNVVDAAGGKTAMAAFTGSALEIGRAWSRLFGEWLPESGYQPDSRPCFELYRADSWDGKTDLFRCQLCLPIRPL